MGKKVLIVDDDDRVRTLLQMWINVQFPEWQTVTADTGERAVALAAHEMPHMAIMDISLPGMNGISATKQIKKSLPGLQVIIYTAHDGYRAAALDAGADAYILKSGSQGNLSAAFKELSRLTEEKAAG